MMSDPSLNCATWPLAELSEDTDHKIAFQETEILTTESNQQKRLLLGSWYIQNTTNPEPPCNFHL